MGRPSILARLAGDAADLAERVLVDQPVDALAHGEAPAVVLALHLVRPAHAPGEFLPAAQFLHLRFPRHLAASRPGCFNRLRLALSRTNAGPDRLQ